MTAAGHYIYYVCFLLKYNFAFSWVPEMLATNLRPTREIYSLKSDVNFQTKYQLLNLTILIKIDYD